MITYTHKAQYYETDQMGVIHHSNYIRWFEEARTYFLEVLGFPYNKMEKDLKIISPVLEVSARYRSMVHCGDLLDITVKAESFNGIKLKLSYEVTDHETGELRTVGTSSHCFLNENLQPVSLKKENPELFERIREQL